MMCDILLELKRFAYLTLALTTDLIVSDVFALFTLDQDHVSVAAHGTLFRCCDIVCALKMYILIRKVKGLSIYHIKVIHIHF